MYDLNIFSTYEESFGICFTEYFQAEWSDLQSMAAAGLLEYNRNNITVTPKGRFLIRNIAMIFDHHLRHKETTAKYSQTV